MLTQEQKAQVDTAKRQYAITVAKNKRFNHRSAKVVAKGQSETGYSRIMRFLAAGTAATDIPSCYKNKVLDSTLAAQRL